MPKVRAEYNDFDYLDQLNDEEKAWLNKFNNEYLNASFEHDDTDIQSYEKYGKDSNDRNNARNRCLYGQLKNTSQNKRILKYDSLNNLDTKIEEMQSNFVDVEAAYVDYLDYKEVEEMINEYLDFMASMDEKTTLE